MSKSKMYTVKIGSIVGGKLKKEGALISASHFLAHESYAERVNSDETSPMFLEVDEKATQEHFPQPVKVEKPKGKK